MEFINNPLIEEFIQFAFREINLSGWRDKLNALRGGERFCWNHYRALPLGQDVTNINIVTDLKRTQMTISELVEENNHFEETMMKIFMNDLYEEEWFSSWIQHYHPEIYSLLSDKEKYQLNDKRSEFSFDYENYLYDLTFDRLMEIIHSVISLK